MPEKTYRTVAVIKIYRIFHPSKVQLYIYNPGELGNVPQLKSKVL